MSQPNLSPITKWATKQTAAKYPLPHRWHVWRKQILEASDWFTAYNNREGL